MDPTEYLNERIRKIAQAAEDKHGPFASIHEAYGVLAEEVAEMFEAMRRDDTEGFARESEDVMAVCMRIAAKWGKK